MSKKISLSLISCWLIAIISILSLFNMKLYKRNDFINNDIVSYYAFLPATFIQHDLSLKFTERPYEGIFWPYTLENGNKLIKTNYGMSLAYSPFFFIGHALAKITGEKQTGFSWPYGLCLLLGTIVYITLAFFLLRKFLLHYFKDASVAISLLLIYFGTNLLYYTLNEPLMSHAYTFSFSIYYLYFIQQWYENKKLKHFIGLAVMLAMLTIIRPTNILFSLLFFFWQVQSFRDIWQSIKIFATQKIFFSLALIFIVFLFYIPQFLYLNYITGHYVFNSYVNERFFFNNPHILEAMFGYRNSVFLYAPVLLLCVPGLYILHKQKSKMFLMSVIYLFIFTYVAFSWWCWWYGGSFGCRAYIDCYAILALALTAVIEKIISSKFKFVAITTIILFFIGLNVANIFRFKKSWIHYSDMTSKTYWHAMTSWKGLNYFDLKQPDYDKAKRGEDEY